MDRAAAPSKCLGRVFSLPTHVHHVQINVRDAINSALDEELARDERVYMMGEEVWQGLCTVGLHVQIRVFVSVVRLGASVIAG